MDELVIESSMAMKLQMGRGEAMMFNRPWRLPILVVTLPASHINARWRINGKHHYLM